MKIFIFELDLVDFPHFQSAIIYLKSCTILISEKLKVCFLVQNLLKKIVRDVLNDVKMTYNIFSVLGFSHENSSYSSEQNV